MRLLEALPNVTAAAAKHARKKPDEMIPIIEDLMKLLDGISDAYRRGKHPDPKEAKQIASLLTAVAKDIEPLSPGDEADGNHGRVRPVRAHRSRAIAGLGPAACA